MAGKKWLFVQAALLLIGTVSCGEDQGSHPSKSTISVEADVKPPIRDPESPQDLVGSLIEEYRSRSSSRALLSGKPMEGNAWDDYSAALRESKAVTFKGSLLGDFLHKPNPATRAKVVGVLGRHSGILVTLRRGAHREQAQYPYEWEAGLNMDQPDMVAVSRVSHLARCQSRLWREEGRYGEALGLLLDLAQFGRDLGHNAPIVFEILGNSTVVDALEEVQAMVVGRVRRWETVRCLPARSTQSATGLSP